MPQELRSRGAETHRYPSPVDLPRAMDPAGSVENAVAFTTDPWTALRADHRLHSPYDYYP